MVGCRPGGCLRASHHEDHSELATTKKKTGLVGPASRSVELICGDIRARRESMPKLRPAFRTGPITCTLLGQPKTAI